MKKNTPKIREREENEKIHSHNLGKGFRGFHSWEWTETGIPAHPCSEVPQPQYISFGIFKMWTEQFLEISEGNFGNILKVLMLEGAMIAKGILPSFNRTLFPFDHHSPSHP